MKHNKGVMVILTIAYVIIFLISYATRLPAFKAPVEVYEGQTFGCHLFVGWLFCFWTWAWWPIMFGKHDRPEDLEPSSEDPEEKENPEEEYKNPYYD